MYCFFYCVALLSHSNLFFVFGNSRQVSLNNCKKFLDSQNEAFETTVVKKLMNRGLLGDGNYLAEPICQFYYENAIELEHDAHEVYKNAKYIIDDYIEILFVQQISINNIHLSQTRQGKALAEGFLEMRYNIGSPTSVVMDNDETNLIIRHQKSTQYLNQMLETKTNLQKELKILMHYELKYMIAYLEAKKILKPMLVKLIKAKS